MNEPINDDELERYLKRADSLSRRYALAASEMPSAAINEAVLAKARGALDEKSGSAMRWRRWPTMTALAATVLLSFGLMMRLALEPRVPMPAIKQQLDQPTGASLATPSANIAADAQLSKTEERAEPAARAKKYSSDSAVTAEAAKPTATSATPRSSDLEQKSSESSARADATNETTVPVASAASESLPARALIRERAVQRATGATAASPPSALRLESTSKALRAKSPETWLEEIEKLKAAGRAEEAAQELARFKEIYPGYLEKRDQAPSE